MVQIIQVDLLSLSLLKPQKACLGIKILLAVKVYKNKAFKHQDKMVLPHLCSKIIFLTKIQKQQGQRNKQMVFKVLSLVIVIIFGALLLLQVNLKVCGLQVSKTLDIRPSHHNKIVVKLAKLYYFLL